MQLRNLINEEENFEASIVLAEESLSSVGYESKFFTKNAGSLLFIIALQPILILLVFLCSPMARACSCCKKLLIKLEEWLKFNPLLRLLLEATLDFSVSIFIQISKTHESVDVSDKFNTYN